MTDEDKANTILSVAAMVCQNESSDMATILLIAIFKLHYETKLPHVTTNDFILLVSDGIRELDAKILPEARMN